MRLPIIATAGHQGKEFVVDCDQETVTLLDAQGEMLGRVSWGELIDLINSAAKEEGFLNLRASPRVPLAVKVRYTTAEGKQFESLTGGVGGGGIFIESSSPLPPGSEVSVEFTLPDRPTERLSAKGKVAWTRNRPERYLLFPGMGVQFLEIDSEAQKRVEELVSALNRSRQIE